MTNKTIKEKIIEEASKYIWGRLKVIFLMIFLIIIVKDHPGWDAFFVVILLLQFVLSIIMIMGLQTKIKEQQYKQEFNNFKNKYKEHYYRNNYNTNRISLSSDIASSSKLLGVNIIQDDNDTIKKKYRKLAMKWHPDKFASDTLENQEIAKRNFQKVNLAYEKIKKYKNIN
jgi:DnaJ-domain-containing protein 1